MKTSIFINPAIAVCLAGIVAPGLAADATPTAKLHALFDAAWERDLADDPLAATFYGDHRYDALWPDLSPAQRERRHAQDRETLAALLAIARDELPPAEQLNHELFRRDYEDRLAEWRFRPEAYEMTPSSGVHALNEVAETLPLASVAEVEAWLKRLETLPQYLDQVTAQLRVAAAEGRTQPRVLMERVLAPLHLQIAGDGPEASPFYARFRQLPDSIPPAERERLAAQARKVIAERVVPAYRRFETFFRDEYLPACRTSVGIWDTPDGAAYYANRVRYHTTTELTPQQIHAIGLAEVARIRAEMQAVMDEIGFKGTPAEFFARLRSDPAYYYPSGDELFAAYVVAAKRIEPELPRLFGKLPRTPYGVRAIPATSAPNTTTAYYMPPSEDGRRAGYYYVNLHRPEVRPKWEIEVLTTHEAVPGHHLQIALAMEQGELPRFRRVAESTAYVEGWALYAERLGYELGLYKDPLSRFGQLTYDMWRAVRLVVDTGLHAERWTREQAIAYFAENAAKTEADIVNEVDRYIGWPGQALAYKIGQLKILELRALAERELGKRFDLRAFHDELLAGGAVPLDVLEQRVKDWIAVRSGGR